MNILERIRAQRFVYILAATVLVAVMILLYIAVFRDANFAAGIESPENIEIAAPEEPISNLSEPDYSYNLTTITVAGSCTPASMLGSNSYGTFNSALGENGSPYFLRNLTDLFRADDFTLAACNAVFSEREGLEPLEDGVNEWYLGTPSNAKVFADGCIDGLVLECPRTGNYGTDGYADTKSAIESAGLIWSDSGKAIYKEINGVKIAVYCGKLSEKTALGVISWTESAREKNDLVILYITDTTEGHLPNANKKNIFRSFIVAGADVVVGTNGTNIQPVEMYGDGFIVYSLGALVDGASRYPDQFTAILKINVRSDNGNIVAKSYEVIPYLTYTEGNPWQPAQIKDSEDMSMLNAFIRGERATPHE